MLAGAGVPILKALQAAAETLSNRAMRADAMDALVLVREGAPLASAMAQKKRFPGLLAMFARLGEQTGQLPQMLQRAANQLGAEVQRRAMQLATILEPLLIVTMGFVVMLIVLAVLLPIIQLNQFAQMSMADPWTTSWWSRSRRARCSTSRKRTRSSRAATRKAYMKLQLERLDVPARPGIAFSLIKKLLAFNDTTAQRVEVVILSRNDPVSGMRIFRSGHANEIKLERGVFTQGRSPFRYLRPLGAHLFLSANAEDVREALAAGFPGGARADRIGAGRQQLSRRSAHRLRRRRGAVLR